MSQIATMFWDMRRRVLLPPMPPNPTVAMFTVSLGAWKPRPSTCRGTMVKPAPAAAVVVRNVRLEMSLMESPRRARFYRCQLSLRARNYDGPKNGNSRRISSAVGRRPYSEISNASAYCTASPRCAP